MKISKIEPIHYEQEIPVYDVVDVQPNHNFAIKTGNAMCISHNCSLMDEPGFENQEEEQLKAEQAEYLLQLTNIEARIKSRFPKVPMPKMFLIPPTAKNTTVVREFIEKPANNKLVINEPLWNVKPAELYSGERFTLAYKIDTKAVEIIDDNDALAFSKYGYEIIKVPVEYKHSFELNALLALKDIGGINI